MHAPPALHDVLGESPSGREIAAVLAFGIGAAVGLTLGLRAESSGLPWWRLLVAALVITDIAAGCVANFTRSTNDFYATRPRNRWMFIAVHGHVLLVAAALGADLAPALAAWAYTVVAASVVNALAGAAAQRFVVGVLLAAALVWIPQLEDVASPLVVVYCLFVLKVVYAFAVDHRAGAHGVDHDRPDARAPIRELAGTDRSGFVTLMSAAFARDLWIEAALGPRPIPPPAPDALRSRRSCSITTACRAGTRSACSTASAWWRERCSSPRRRAGAPASACSHRSCASCPWRCAWAPVGPRGSTRTCGGRGRWPRSRRITTSR